MRLVLPFLLTVLASSPAAHAAAPPSPRRLVEIGVALDTSTFVRVIARRGRFESRAAHADSAGLWLVRSHGRAALFGSADAPTDERLIPWSEVQRVEAGRAASAAPFVLGTALGLMVLTGAFLSTTGSDHPRDSIAMAVLWAVPLSVGCAVGGLALSLGTSDMSRIYP